MRKGCDGSPEESKQNKKAAGYYQQTTCNHRQSPVGENFGKQIILGSNQRNHNAGKNKKFFHCGRKRRAAGRPLFSIS